MKVEIYSRNAIEKYLQDKFSGEKKKLKFISFYSILT